MDLLVWILGSALGTTLHPRMCNGSCSYVKQSLVVVGPRRLSIMGSLWSFLRTLWRFDILRIQTDRCFGVLVRHLTIAHNISWILFLFGTAIGLSWSNDLYWLRGPYVYIIGYIACFLNQAGPGFPSPAIYFCQMWLTSRLAVNRPTCYSLCPVSQCSVCAPLKHLKWRLLNYFHLGTLYWHGLDLIPIWMSNYIRYKVWDTAVGVWEWING